MRVRALQWLATVVVGERVVAAVVAVAVAAAAVMVVAIVVVVVVLLTTVVVVVVPRRLVPPPTGPAVAVSMPCVRRPPRLEILRLVVEPHLLCLLLAVRGPPAAAALRVVRALRAVAVAARSRGRVRERVGWGARRAAVRMQVAVAVGREGVRLEGRPVRGSV